MNEQIVVSCPRCIRQYQVDAATDHIVAQCGVCKAHFVLIIPRLTGPSDGALVLDKEIEPTANFFKEACETLARNVCDLIRLAGGEITPEAVENIVESLPRSGDDLDRERWRAGALSQVLRLAFDSGQEREQLHRLTDYFLKHIPNRSYFALDMLQGAFAGVLGGIDWPTPVEPPAEEVTPKADRPDGSGAATTPLPPRLRRFSWFSGKGSGA